MITSFGDEGRTKFTLAVGVGLESLVQVESGEIDFLVPVSVGVVVAAGVEEAVGDGVVADFFAMSIAKYENCGRQGLRRSAARCSGGVVEFDRVEGVPADRMLDGFAF